MLLRKNNWGIGLALPVRQEPADHPILDKSCHRYSGILVNARRDVFKIAKAGAEDIEWWLRHKDTSEGDRNEKLRIKDGVEYYFGSTTRPWGLPPEQWNGEPVRLRLEKVRGMGTGSRSSCENWDNQVQIIADQPSAIDKLIAMAQLRPTEVYIYCNQDWLIQTRYANGNPYPGDVPQGWYTFWDKVHKDWYGIEPSLLCDGHVMAFADGNFRNTVVFCEWTMRSLKPSGRALLDFKIEKGALLDQIDDRFKLARIYGHEMLHTVPVGRGMSPYMYALLVDLRSCLLIISSQLWISR